MTSEPMREPQESGWALFAGVLFMLSGFFHVMWGIAALASDDDFVVAELVFGSLTLWGLLYLAIGAAQLAAAWLIANAKRSGRALGIVLASLSATNAMLTFGARPLWSATILLLDLLVIYGLVVHDAEFVD